MNLFTLDVNPCHYHSFLYHLLFVPTYCWPCQWQVQVTSQRESPRQSWTRRNKDSCSAHTSFQGMWCFVTLCWLLVGRLWLLLRHKICFIVSLQFHKGQWMATLRTWDWTELLAIPLLCFLLQGYVTVSYLCFWTGFKEGWRQRGRKTWRFQLSHVAKGWVKLAGIIPDASLVFVKWVPCVYVNEFNQQQELIL